MWSVDTKTLEEKGVWIWTSLSDHTLPIAKPTCRPQSNYWTVDMGNKASSSHRSATLMPEDEGSFLLVFEEGRLTRKQVLQALRSMQHVQRMTAVPEAATQSQFTYKIEISACVLESEAANLLINSILIDLSPQWTLKSAQVALKEYDERQPLLRVNARQQNLLLTHVLQAMARYHTNMEVLSYSTTSRYTDPSGKALSHLLHKNHATLKQVGICTPSRRISDHFMVHLTRGLGIEDCSSTLQFLTLHSSQLTDHEFHELVLPALQKHTSLEALDLSRNPGLSAASLIPLTSLVQEEGALNLKALYLNHTNVLNDCQFSTELTPFMEALESNRTLAGVLKVAFYRDERCGLGNALCTSIGQEHDLEAVGCQPEYESHAGCSRFIDQGGPTLEGLVAIAFRKSPSSNHNSRSVEQGSSSHKALSGGISEHEHGRLAA